MVPFGARCRVASVVMALALVVTGSALAQSSAREVAELARTWAAAWVFVPADGGVEKTTVAALAQAQGGRRLPAVVYAHGCAGLDLAAETAGRFLAGAGFIVVAPDGFARRVKPQSCDPARHRGGLHRGVLGWRQAEIDNALRRLRALPAVDGEDVFLVGFSEGAIAVATYRGARVRGRVIEGWTCHAGWPEYRGLNAPADEPVLALVADGDPWFQAPWLRGDCGAFMAGRTGARSLVYAPPSPLAYRHWLSALAPARDAIVGFLLANRRQP